MKVLDIYAPALHCGFRVPSGHGVCDTYVVAPLVVDLDLSMRSIPFIVSLSTRRTPTLPSVRRSERHHLIQKAVRRSNFGHAEGYLRGWRYQDYRTVRPASATLAAGTSCRIQAPVRVWKMFETIGNCAYSTRTSDVIRVPSVCARPIWSANASRTAATSIDARWPCAVRRCRCASPVGGPQRRNRAPVFASARDGYRIATTASVVLDADLDISWAEFQTSMPSRGSGWNRAPWKRVDR